MSDIVRNSTSFRKRAMPDSILPSPGNKTLVFHHQASGGESSITLSALVVPTSLPGYANPSLSDLLGSRLSLYPGSMELISSLNGVLQPDVTWKCNTPSAITFLSYTLTNGEIITGIIRPVNTDGVLVTDARALCVTGVLSAGQDTIVTNPFTLNKYSTGQVGDVLVFFNGQLQLRNVGNATAAPSADGNYQEVPVAGGLTNQIKANSPVGVDTSYVVVSNGLVAERPTNSLMAAIEAVQGKVDAMIPDLAALAGNPTTAYSSQTPTNVDLASFGQTLLAMKVYTDQLAAPYIPFTPIGTSDGSPAASRAFLSFAYKQVGKTVFFRGVLELGRTSSGAGGTFIKFTLPIPGKAGIQQDGIGAVGRDWISITAPTTDRKGWGRILSSDTGNVLLMWTDVANVTDADFTASFGGVCVVDGHYETD